MFSFGCADASQNNLFVGKDATSFVAQDLDGKDVDLAKYIGKEPVLLVFFATWCPPCRKEVPELISINNMYKDQGLKLIATSLDNSAKVLPGFINKNKIDYTVLHDGNKEGQRAYQVQGIPTNILIDRSGVIKYFAYSPPSEKDIESLLE
jgi:peroxiredoxin